MNIFIKIIYVFLIFTFLPLTSFADDDVDKYGYIKKDTATEQKRFVLRLKEDEKKVDLAIENTKVLINKSRTRPYLPELYLRLAELYIEKSRIVYFIRNKQLDKPIKALDHLESNSLKNQAIEIYQRILDNFPNFGERDKVHFFMAHEYRELGQIPEMVKQYRVIIKNYKESSYAAEAYLLIGDNFFEKDDIEMALRHYESVFNYAESSAIAIARYKLGWIYINKLDFVKAIKLFEDSVTSVSSTKKIDIDTYKRVDVKLESLIDMAFCYSEVYKESTPDEVIAYFKEYSWSRPVFVIVLEKMAYRFLIKKKWKHAAVLYRHLSTLQQDAEKLLVYVRNIFECVREMDTFEDADQDMAIIIKALEKQKYSIYATDKEKEVTEYELYARDIVTHLHKKARNVASIAGYKRAADAYRIYLDFFTNSSAYEEMVSNYAEALFSANEYIEAGKYYEQLSSKMANYTNEREEKLYGAVVSYYNALKERENLNYYQTVFAREGLKTTGKIFTGEFPDSKRVPHVSFNVAWVTYDAGKYDEAIGEFSKFVERYPEGKEAKAAIHLILDAYNIKEDYEGLVKYGNSVIANNEIGDTTFNKEITSIVRAAESKIINYFAITAVKDWDKGRSAIMDFVKGHKSSSLGEQALYALIAPSIEKGDFETLFKTGEQLIAQYPNSSRSENTLDIMINFALNTSQFRLLAHYLETFAERFPKHNNTIDFLYQAAHIRENLGEYAQANKNYQLFFDHSKTQNSDKQAEIIFALADNANRMGNIDLEYKFLIEKKKYLSKIGQVKADALIANYYFEKQQIKTAQGYTEKAKKGYQPGLVEKGAINPIMAQLEYNSMQSLYKEYMGIQLNNVIDNNIVKKKGLLLQRLEKGYLAVIQYQSPKWALIACYRLFEINDEFGRFLKESPLPSGLLADQQAQYQQIINTKAMSYKGKADKYLQTCIKQAHKWEISDPELVKYYANLSASSQRANVFDHFSRPTETFEISEQFLKDETLRPMHEKLFQEPNNIDTLFKLSLAYAKRSDYRQSILIAQKALDGIKDTNDPIKALVYNTLGVCYLFLQDDEVARDAFKKALTVNPEHIGARVNLAGYAGRAWQAQVIRSHCL